MYYGEPSFGGECKLSDGQSRGILESHQSGGAW